MFLFCLLFIHHMYHGKLQNYMLAQFYHLAFGYCCLHLWVWVCVSVCVCINHKLVCVITHHPFKLGPPNLNQRCKTLRLRSLLFWRAMKVKFNFKSPNLPHFEFVCAISHHPFKLRSPYLDQRCKTPWSRSLLFGGMIDLDLQGQF